MTGESAACRGSATTAVIDAEAVQLLEPIPTRPGLDPMALVRVPGP